MSDIRKVGLREAEPLVRSTAFTEAEQMSPSYQEVLQELASGDFMGPRDEGLLTRAEAALGAELPPSYREFACRLGAGNYRSLEVYGLIDESFGGPVPDAVWVTLEERKSGSIPDHAIIVGDSGDGGWYWTSLGNVDGPVFLTAVTGTTEEVAPSFPAYLNARLRSEN